MNAKLKGWMVPLLLLGAMAYCLAEEITLTTYYPSPRGVYDELRTKGDVAIGKLDPPGARLEIVGGGATTGTALRVRNVDQTPLLEVQNNGNVGIGTTGPGAKLQVSGDALITSTLNMGSIGSGGGTAGKVGFGGVGGLIDGFSIGNNLGGNRLTFQADSNPTTAFFVMTNAGNVGIGTTGPNGPLDVRLPSSGQYVQLGTNGVVSSVRMTNGRLWSESSAFQMLGRNISGAATPLWFGVTENSPLMVMTTSGNVGIGTQSPDALLSVGSNTFQVNSSGNLVRVNNVAYSWPSSQGGASTALTNDGSGNLSWGAGASGITATLGFAIPCNQSGTLSIDVSNGIITGSTTGYNDCGGGDDDSGGGGGGGGGGEGEGEGGELEEEEPVLEIAEGISSEPEVEEEL